MGRGGLGLVTIVHKGIFHALRFAGMPLGDLRGRGPLLLAYEKFGRKAYPQPAKFFWFRNRWGHEFYLSYSYHIDRAILIHGMYDRPLHNAIARRVKPGMICMDIGANLGEVTVHMASKVGPGGTVYSFEPVPHVYRRLVAHVARNGFEDIAQTFDIALSNTNSPVNLAFADEYADNQGLASIVNTERCELTSTHQVQSYTLDSFVSQHNISHVDLVKIDIQGGEWCLLEGGMRVLSEMGPDLLMEFSPNDLRQIGKDSRELARVLEDLGYHIYSLNADGTAGCHFVASSFDPDFSAPNMLCTKRV